MTQRRGQTAHAIRRRGATGEFLEYGPPERNVQTRSQGPRKVGILGLKARILAGQGKDKAPVLREQLVKALGATPQAKL